MGVRVDLSKPKKLVKVRETAYGWFLKLVRQENEQRLGSVLPIGTRVSRAPRQAHKSSN